VEKAYACPSERSTIVLGQVQYEQKPHVLHTVDAGRAYWPALQEMHLACESNLEALEKVPAGQLKQVPRPSEDQYPGEQGVQTVAPYRSM
jgi:hypothetical protein